MIQEQNSNKKLYYIISGLLLCISIFMFFSPSINDYFKGFSQSKKRLVLSKIETNSLNNQIKLTLIKVKQDQKLALEIYAHMNHGLELIETLSLDGTFDAYLSLNDRTSNLLISNIDGDPGLEVIIPTYDSSMRPILNVYKYDSNLEEFKKVNTKDAKPIL